MTIIKPKAKIALTEEKSEEERIIPNVDFNIYKLNVRPRPTNPKNVVIFSCFSEFGCEIVGAMYCIPRLLERFAGHYKIVMGWWGRKYLYQHLVDEYWELKEEHQWLREYCRAFHHESKNLTKIEASAEKHGIVVPAASLGHIAVGNRCRSCGRYWGEIGAERCVGCKSKNITKSLFGDIHYWKPQAIRIPQPGESAMDWARSRIPPNAVGIFARARKCYGRNLPAEFYMSLIQQLKNRGYSPVWLGEKQSVLPCPDPSIPDYSGVQDLESVLALIKQMRFTIQFWTASTRLASLVDVPYLLFESPDQVWGKGQEGYRRQLCDFGDNKLSCCLYLRALENPDLVLEHIDSCISDIENGDFSIRFDLLEERQVAKDMQYLYEMRKH